MKCHLRKACELRADYLVFLPAEYEAKPELHWPLILFLHGAGERGSDVQRAVTHGPAKYLAKRADFPFILVAPQCPVRQIWSNVILLALLEEVLGQHRVDRARVYLTGLSMGGYATWNLGLSHPDRFAAIVPICGGGEMISLLLSDYEPTKAHLLKTLAVWAFHGAQDPIVPISESYRMVDVLRKRGVHEVKFTTYPEAQHDAWTATYDNPELYDWLLQHKR